MKNFFKTFAIVAITMLGFGIYYSAFIKAMVDTFHSNTKPSHVEPQSKVKYPCRCDLKDYVTKR